MIKELYIDLETTGLLAGTHGVIQIAAIATVDGREVAEFNECGRIFAGQRIDAQALDANGRSITEIEGFQPATALHEKFVTFLAQHVDRFEKSDKFHFIAYNSPFDNEHLRQFFARANDKFFGSYFWTPDQCVMRRAARVLREEREKLPNFKLATVAEHLGLLRGTEKLHNALDDVRLTIAIDRALDERQATYHAQRVAMSARKEVADVTA